MSLERDIAQSAYDLAWSLPSNTVEAVEAAILTCSEGSLRAEISKRVAHHQHRDIALAFVDRWQNELKELDARTVAVALKTAVLTKEQRIAELRKGCCFEGRISCTELLEAFPPAEVDDINAIVEVLGRELVWPLDHETQIANLALLAAFCCFAMRAVESDRDAPEPTNDSPEFNGIGSVDSVLGEVSEIAVRCGWEIPLIPPDDKRMDVRAARFYLHTLWNWVVEKRKNLAISPGDQRVRGVSLRDVALFLNQEDAEGAGEWVKRWWDSKKIKASKLGKCPKDGRAVLYELSELLSDAADFSHLSPAEKKKLETHLTSLLRPIADNK